MPVSKKRKKKSPTQSLRFGPELVPAYPLWEYRSLADELAAAEPDLTAAQALIILLHSPYRLWDDSGHRIRTVFPAIMAKAAGTALLDWLVGMELLHDGGFLSWEDENQAHYLSIPG